MKTKLPEWLVAGVKVKSDRCYGVVGEMGISKPKNGDPWEFIMINTPDGPYCLNAVYAEELKKDE